MNSHWNCWTMNDAKSQKLISINEIWMFFVLCLSSIITFKYIQPIMALTFSILLIVLLTIFVNNLKYKTLNSEPEPEHEHVGRYLSTNWNTVFV